MIVRRWSGRVPRRHAAGFLSHLKKTGIAEYRKQPGCVDIQLLQCEEGGCTRFVLLSTWRSMEDIRRFSGPESTAAVLYPGDELYELDPDRTVEHFELICLNSGCSEEVRQAGRQAGNCDRLARPVGPFSHYGLGGSLIFLSGQVGQDPQTGRLKSGGVEAQARQILQNVDTLLKAKGWAWTQVVKVNVFLSSMENFAAMNGVYSEHFRAPYPARTTVAVQELPLGAQVEMEMILER